MDPLTSTDDQIDVTTSLYSNSETDGFVKALDGDWEVTSDFSGVGAWREDNILGRTNLKAGPGLFVGALNGSYTCRGDLLSYRTLDPVENATVNVLLDRVK